jgi:hypothetical protein
MYIDMTDMSQLERDYMELQSNPLAGVDILSDRSAANSKWILKITP